MQLSRVVEVTGGEKVICYHEKVSIQLTIQDRVPAYNRYPQGHVLY